MSAAHASAHIRVFAQCMKYMQTRKLAPWMEKLFKRLSQRDSNSCGILALMYAEAAIHGENVDVIRSEAAAVKFYRQYVLTRLTLSSRSYDPNNGTICDNPFCLWRSEFVTLPHFAVM